MMKQAEREHAKKQPCRMNGCDRTAECPESGLCKRCYAWLDYQIRNHKTVTQLLRRLEQIKFWDNRLSGFLEGESDKPKRRVRRRAS